jgi:RNA polymerase sigma factor (sigma-70 family)
MEPTTRHSLVLRLSDPHDAAAWAEFVELYEPLLYRLARGRGFQDADARDLCQDVLRAVAAAVGRWDPDPAKGRFRAWLFRIARNRLASALAARRDQGSGRTSVHERLESEPAPADEPAEFATEFRRRAFAWAATRVRDEVAPATWQAFWQTGVENRPVADVAAELGMTAGAVYVARSRVLARLREQVEQLTADSGLDWENGDAGAAGGV